jgi:CheY-like chemotaxis protein
LVDDSPSVRYSAASILRKHGWEVTSAEDGSAAIEFLLRSTVLPDVIVSDLEMPKVDGLGFLRHLKADTRYENIPVVVCSSRKDPEHVESATSLGAATYLFKPFAETEFIQAVENAR